jgi:hydroxypyruvate isomerase
LSVAPLPMLRFCANVSWLFRELPFLERPAAARRAGFTAIEFHALESCRASELARAARDADICIALFNASPGDLLSGGPGLSGVPGREAAFRLAVQEACELGAAFGGSLVQIGASRVPAGCTRTECLDTFVHNLADAAQRLQAAGCRALIEPMNAVDLPEVLIADLVTATTVLQRLRHPAVGLQFDCYHQRMAGGTVIEAIETLRERIDHLQFSTTPGRHEPGCGELDLPAVLRSLERVGYRGWVAAEYRPSRPTLETLHWLDAYRHHRDGTHSH